MARHRGLPVVLAGMLLTLAATAGAELLENTLDVPVRLALPGGGTLQQTMLVTVVRDDARRRAPYAVLLHGRPPQASAFARLGRLRYPANAAWLVSQGFTVLIPTRVGYGLSGGPDLDYTGECDAKHHVRGLAAALAETRQLLAYAARLPYVDPQRGVVIGESFGGLAAVALAAEPLPGLQAAINFAGGDGGDFDHPGAPCRADQLAATFARYGRSNLQPVLWLYSANDLLWGATLPRQWFDAFAAAGGQGRFVALPANGANGHFVFNHGAADWHAAVQAFLAQRGLGAHGSAP